MNIGNAKLLICPFCKGEKPVIQLASGNTFGATQRSDLKTDYPMLQTPSPIQKCPHCGRYFFTNITESRKASFQSFDKEELTYEQIKEALQQFENTTLEKENEILLRLLFVQTYNTTFQLEGVPNQPIPTEEEKNLFCHQVERLIEIWEIEPIVKAELLREAGQFDQSLKLLDTLQVNEPFQLKIAHQIRLFAEKQQTKAFIVYGSRNDFI